MGAEMGAQRPIGCRSAKGCGAAPFCRDDERTALRTKSIPRTPSKRKRPVKTGIPAYLRAYLLEVTQQNFERHVEMLKRELG